MKRLVLLGFILAGTICMAQTTNYIPKYNSSTTFNNSVIYQTNSNIGIGTTSPLSKLHVNGSIYMPIWNGVNIGNTSNSGQYFRLYHDGGWAHADFDGILCLDGTTVNCTGKLGIGTAYPSTKLHVIGNSTMAGNLSINHTSSADYEKALQIKVDRNYSEAISVLNTSSNNTQVFRVNGNGVVGAKKIYAESFEVLSGAVGIYWFDHVFDKNYNLRTLSEVEEYINENHHLPEIPSQQEVNENGYNLGDMQGKLLMKIEELTLYIIELEKRISELEGKERGE